MLALSVLGREDGHISRLALDEKNSTPFQCPKPKSVHLAGFERDEYYTAGCLRLSVMEGTLGVAAGMGVFAGSLARMFHLGLGH
jgi:hypothetical protein